MKNQKAKTAALLIVVILFMTADGLLLFMTELPRLEDASSKREWEGIDLLQKYEENPDMVGWLQVEGTNINYPVMRGEKYLHRDFKGNTNASGSLFVDEDWSENDLCTLIYGHNMWMYGTMLHALHDFTEADFFRSNREIDFYVIRNAGFEAEKRTFDIVSCSRTRVDRWNYASCRYISSGSELDAFLEECESRAVRMREAGREAGEGIVLSTCSYHVNGGKGRLIVAGILTGKKEQSRIDVRQKTD